MSEKKYEITDETIEVDGCILHRTRRLRDSDSGHAGNLGGLIEKDLRQALLDCGFTEPEIYGVAEVYSVAKVYGVENNGDDKISSESDLEDE